MNNTNNKLLFILPSLKAGGAERVISFIAKKLHQRSYNVKLIILGFEKDKVYDLENLNVQYLNKFRLLTSVFNLFQIIIKEKPSIVFSSISHVNILMSIFSLFFRKIKFIAREASVISELNKFSDKKSNVRDFLIKQFYSRLDLIICQSEDMKYDLINQFGILSSKLKIINNPITFTTINNHRENDASKINFITIGRLSKEKGHERLLNCLSSIKTYDFNYKIIGDGSELDNINSLISLLGLNNKVNIISYTDKISEALSQSDIFLQGSYVEGFPNSVLESCFMGTPVIAFESAGGTKEIINQGVNGFIVNNKEDFINLLNDKNKLLNFNSDEIKKSVKHKFSSKKILLEYESAINSVLNNR